MFPEANLFVEGERQLGRYTVTVARYANSHWTPTVPPLNVVVTNRRLFLRPEVRKKYQPASIPSTYITKVRSLELDGRHAVSIALKTGHQLYIFIGREHGEQLLYDISCMQAPPTRIHFDHNIVAQDIQRLIDFFNRMT